MKENFVNILSCEVGVTSSACCWRMCYLLCWFWRLASIQGYVNPSTKVGSALTITLIWSHHRCGPGSLTMCHWRTGAWLRQAFSHDPLLSCIPQHVLVSLLLIASQQAQVHYCFWTAAETERKWMFRLWCFDNVEFLSLTQVHDFVMQITETLMNIEDPGKALVYAENHNQVIWYLKKPLTSIRVHGSEFCAVWRSICSMFFFIW